MTIESLPTFTKPARQRWESIPADIRQRLLSNVWCGHCRQGPLSATSKGWSIFVATLPERHCRSEVMAVRARG